MSLNLESIIWDGNCLSVTVAFNRRRVMCTIPRDTIHAISMYNDAVGWEIDRHKGDIFQRVKRILENKLKQAPEAAITHMILQRPDLALDTGAG